MCDELDEVHLLLDALILQVVINDARQLNKADNRHDDDRQQRNLEDSAEIDTHNRGDAQPANIVHQLVDRPPHRPRWPNMLTSFPCRGDAEAEVAEDEDDCQDEKPQHLLPPLNER